MGSCLTKGIAIGYSYFNQIDIAEAHSKGEKFFKSYQAFQGNDEVKDKVHYVPQIKEIFRHPEIDIDSF